MLYRGFIWQHRARIWLHMAAFGCIGAAFGCIGVVFGYIGVAFGCMGVAFWPSMQYIALYGAYGWMAGWPEGRQDPDYAPSWW